MKSLLTTWRAAILLAMCLPFSSHAADGTPAWTNFFNGTGNGHDQANAIAVDASGDVFVTGTTAGNNGTSNNFATIKYSSAGVPAWTQIFNGVFNGNDEARAIGVDGGGNVYVTGTTAGNGTANDVATIKYSNAGVPAWTKIFNGALNGNDEASDIAVDAGGNAYVTGKTAGSGTGDNFVTLKYTTAGTLAWTQFFNGAVNGSDRASAIALDGSGNVCVTGTTAGSGTGDNFATIKYSNAGAPMWTNFFNGTVNGNDEATAIAADGSGNVYVTGTTTGSGTGNDFATIKYSNAGATLWTKIFNGALNGGDEASAIAVDGVGNVYVTGTTAGNGTSNDFVTVKYSSAGVPAWTNFFKGSFNGNDEARDIALDASGNAYVTGLTTGNGTSGDYATLKYSTAGVPVWTNFFKGTANGNDTPNALAVGSGGVHVTGSMTTSASGLDFATIEYSLGGGGTVSTNFTSVQQLPGKVILQWGGNSTLQFSPVVTGPYTNIVGATSPYTNDTAGNAGFFRLVGN